MPQSAQLEDDDPKDKIWSIINSVLQGFPMTITARSKLNFIIMKGSDKVKYDIVDEARALEAEENFRYFAKELLKNVEGHKSIISNSDIQNVLSFICPLYPIC